MQKGYLVRGKKKKERLVYFSDFERGIRRDWKLQTRLASERIDVFISELLEIFTGD